MIKANVITSKTFCFCLLFFFSEQQNSSLSISYTNIKDKSRVHLCILFSSLHILLGYQTIDPSHKKGRKGKKWKDYITKKEPQQIAWIKSCKLAMPQCCKTCPLFLHKTCRLPKKQTPLMKIPDVKPSSSYLFVHLLISAILKQKGHPTPFSLKGRERRHKFSLNFPKHINIQTFEEESENNQKKECHVCVRMVRGYPWSH